ncbi:MAG: WD40 repeat-like protein [Hyperionvirus sp.]|uniref:WD40 repeat-like protein n=1 Tax=Hyperionvirus sp. TaxID=2487770 RepID=A0A3G5A917_9VIRU|nr:MAG: WD40 repeat-like protein [Hyperionvirus sp.]
MLRTAKASARGRKHGKLLSLPVSIAEFIFGWLELRDLARVGRVCVALNNYSMSDNIWRSCVLSRWSLSSATAKRIVNSRAAGYGTSPNVWRLRYRELARIMENWRTGKYEEVILHGHTGRINAVSCGANILVSCSEDKTIRVWHIPTRECLHVLHGHTKPITDVRFDEKEVISSSLDGSIRIWSMLTGKEERRLQTIDHNDNLMKAIGSDLTGFTCSVRRLKCTSDKIFCGGFQGQVLIWDRETGNPLHTLLTPSTAILASDRLPVECIDVDGNNLVVGLGDHVFVYDLTIHNEEYSTSPHLTMNHPSVRTIRLLTASVKTVVTLGGTHINVFSMLTGLLVQSLLIRNHGFVPIDIHDTKSTTQIFDRFILETPEIEADSADLGHVRVWRAFGQKLTEPEALKILVSRHHAKCSNAEVLVVADRSNHELTLHDYTIPTPIPIAAKKSTPNTCVLL